MASDRVRKVTLLAVIIFGLILLPNPSHTAVASPPPKRFYEPAFSTPLNSTPNMPLPAPSLTVRPTPVSGDLKILVIAAAFAGTSPTLSISAIQTEWSNQVAKYYQEDSLGKVTLTVTVIGWFKLPYNEAHYGADCPAEPGGGIDDPGCIGQDQSWNIAQDAATLANKNATFANYDYYVFLHSGNGQESTGVKNNVWSVTYLGGVYINPCQNAEQGCNQPTITKFSVVPELEAGGAVPIGVYCHEFGHQLGLPDLYNTSTGQTILGPWSLMDKGLWNGNPPGSSPSHMDAWSKIQLGFFSGSMIATANPGTTTTYTIDPTEVASSNVHAVVVPIGSTISPIQYYIIEARSDTGFDAALPSWGVFILYVNTAQLIGKVQIVNANPTVTDLSQATWTTGQTYTNSKDGWSMTVTAQVGGSYQVTVNRGGAPPPPQPRNQTYISLAITSISAEPPVITLPNTTVTVTVDISNAGTETANNVPLEVDLDGRLYTNMQISVAARATTPASFTWVSTVGTHTFKVIIDPGDTINNTNRANNSATFTLSVGPTLTINFPLNITTAGNVWVKINGAKHNITSTQFQTSVPNGTISVEIEPSINTSQGVRQRFAGWSDGNTDNPRNITVSAGTVLQAEYTTQYLLSVNSNGGTTTASGWYAPNTTVTVSADNPSNVTANASRYLFTSWSGDLASNSTSLTVTISKPVTLQANWLKQYYVTIISSAGSPTGEGWYNAGTVVTVGVQSTVQYPNGTRMIFNGWNSTAVGNAPTTQITVDAPTLLFAEWQTQYLVTVNSEYGNVLGSGWYNAGSSAQVSVAAEINYENMTRREFRGWVGDYTGTSNSVSLRVDAPKNLNAQWATQYLVTLSASGLPNSTVLTLNLNNLTYGLAAGSSYQTWIDQGTPINPTINQTITNGILSYKFTGWRNATGQISQNPLLVDAPGIYIASYAPTLSLPAIPGFPIEATVLGLLIGAIMLAIKRNFKSRTNRITLKNDWYDLGRRRPKNGP